MIKNTTKEEKKCNNIHPTAIIYFEIIRRNYIMNLGLL